MRKGIYPVVSVGTKPPLVHVVEALNQEYHFPVTKSLSGTPWLATKAHFKFPAVFTLTWLHLPELRKMTGALIFFLKYAEKLHIIVLSRRIKEFTMAQTPSGDLAGLNGKPFE